jgi:hypothetical protein
LKKTEAVVSYWRLAKSNYLGVLFTEQDSMDFEPALFLAVQNEEVGEYAVNGFSCNSDEPRSYCDRCLGWL